MKGSYTAEAALICPWIFFSVIFLWYMGFFQHNRVACRAICKEAAYAGMEAKRRMEDVEAAAQKVLEDNLDWLPGNPDIETMIHVDKGEIYVRIEMTMGFPFEIFSGTLIGETWKASEEETLALINPVREIRKIRTAERLKDVLTEKMEEGGFSDEGGI